MKQNPVKRPMSREYLKRIPAVNVMYRATRFLTLQARVAFTDWRDGRDGTADETGFPLPPARLRHRVHGDVDAGSFIRTGQTVAADIADLVQAAGHSLSSFHDILDFGCGCGRVLRHMASSNPQARVCGTDIDAQAIRWCEGHMPGVNWRANQFMPPLPWENGTFDFVFSISVFTHLNEGMQDAWLAELQRVSRPDALLLLTVHGESVHPSLPSEQQAALRHSGFAFWQGVTGRLKLDGLPDFYQSAYHTARYIEAEWSRFFRIIAIVPRGINKHQDAVLLQRR
ncbi:MAG: class I SAM-dependent methyltransferase [bacterium]